MKVLKIALVSILICCCRLHAVAQYLQPEDIIREAQQLQTRYATIAEYRTIGKSYGGIDLPLIKITINPSENLPAILVVAGIDGRHQTGSQLALKVAADLLKDSRDSTREVLNKHHIYILPCINPDAQKAYFENPRYERRGNDHPTDHDRDGRIQEDPYEDLNADGLITFIRIEDPSGTHIVHPEDDRVLIAADPSKGEKGKYLLFSEGFDNDKDGRFNEDGPGGVWIDKNFSFDYPAFAEGAGEMAVSESEARALLDFIYQHPQIHTIITFGPSNNLIKVAPYDESKATARFMTAPAKKDVEAAEWVSSMYKRNLEIEEAPDLPLQKGDFTQTAYFHLGRFSYVSPGWWAPKVEIPKDTTEENTAKDKKDDRAREELNFLRWADREGLDVFVPWQSIQHEDFPGKNVEVGGMKPFAMLNPPLAYLDSASHRHVNFIRDLLWSMPKIELADARVEQIDKQLFRVTLKLVNQGMLPTGTASGDKLRYMPNLKTEIVINEKQKLVSGKKHYLRNSLAPGESEEYSWLIQGQGNISIEAGSPAAGKSFFNTQLK
jgi:hypothetical protein